MHEQDEPKVPEPGRYRHFKGGVYVVVGYAIHTETSETMVIYHLDGNRGLAFVRPLEMWAGLVDGKPRFERLEP